MAETSVEHDGDGTAPPARQAPLSAVAINGVVVAATSASSSRPPLLLPPASAREFLLSRPRGAYTALRVSSSGAAQFWQEHCERLAATLVILSEEEKGEKGEQRGREGDQPPPPLPLFTAWHASEERAVPLPLASLVGDTLLPGVRAAVAAVRELQRGAEAAAGGAAGAAAEEEENKDAAPRPVSSSSSRCSGEGPVHVVVLLSEPVADGTEEEEEEAEEAPQKIQRRQRPESLPLDVAVFASAGSSPSSPSVSDGSAPSSVPVLSLAAVVGGPRERPHAKDSLWVRARVPLERKLAEAAKAGEGGGEGGEGAGAREGLLADEGGRLLEGLVTNFFVVVAEDEDEDEDEDAGEGGGGGGGEGEASERGSSGGGCDGCDAGDLSRFSLLTASASNDGVLDGTMRRAVIEAAEALGIRVLDSCAPDPKEGRQRHRWTEAFVTSALRGVAAVARLQGGEEGGEIKPWSVSFLSHGQFPGRVTRAISAELPRVIRRHEVKL